MPSEKCKEDYTNPAGHKTISLSNIQISDPTKPQFRFRFRRNPKVSVSIETQFQPKPKPKPKFLRFFAFFHNFTNQFEPLYIENCLKLLMVQKKCFVLQFQMPFQSIQRLMEFYSESCTYFYSKEFRFWFRFWFHRYFWVSVSVSPKPKNGFRSITTSFSIKIGRKLKISINVRNSYNLYYFSMAKNSKKWR